MDTRLPYEKQQIKAKPQLNIVLRPLVPRHRLSQTQATDDYK